MPLRAREEKAFAMGHVAQGQAGFMCLELEGEDSMVYFSLSLKHVGKQGSSP